MSVSMSTPARPDDDNAVAVAELTYWSPDRFDVEKLAQTHVAGPNEADPNFLLARLTFDGRPLHLARSFTYSRGLELMVVLSPSNGIRLGDSLV